MKNQIITLSALLIINIFSFKAISQTQADSAAVNAGIADSTKKTDSNVKVSAEQTVIDARVDKLLQKLNATVQLTPEQTKELKQLYIQREQLRMQMKATDPKSDTYLKLQGDYENLNLQIKMILTDEQKAKLDEKEKTRIKGKSEDKAMKK